MELTSPGLAWLIIAVLFFLLEMAVPGFILFFFGAGALVTSLVCWVMPLSLNGQLLLFLIASLATLFSLRGLVQRIFFGDSTDEADEENSIALGGETAVVTAAIIPPAEGKIKFSGSFWTATADEEIEEKSVVTIVRQKGLLMHVMKKQG